MEDFQEDYGETVFIEENRIGKGGFGQVFKARFRATETVHAIKKFLQAEGADTINDQINEALKQIQIQLHVNIIKILSLYQSVDKCELFIAMEYANRSLEREIQQRRQRAEPFAETELVKMFVTLVEALRYLKKIDRVFHRDISTDNILILDNVIKLCDFGNSISQQEAQDTWIAGKFAYFSPRTLRAFARKQVDYISPDLEKADIYALGMVFF